MNRNNYLVFLTMTLTILNYSCTVQHPDNIESGSGVLKRFNTLEFTYDSQNRLYKVDGSSSATNPLDTVTFFYNTNSSRVFRIEALYDVSSTIKKPIILEYDNNNNLVKIITKDTIQPTSPNFNNLTYLSTFDRTTDINFQIDSIIYNSKNNPTELYDGFSLGTAGGGTVYSSRHIIVYHPGDTLIKEIRKEHSSSTGYYIEDKLILDSLIGDHVNPVWQTYKYLYMIKNIHRNGYSFLPMSGFVVYYTQSCDQLLGIAKYLPKVVTSVSSGFSNTYHMIYQFDTQNKLKIIYRTYYSGGDIDYSNSSAFDYY